MKTFYLENFINEHGLPLSIRNSVHAKNTEPHTHNYIEIVFIRAGHAIHHLHSRDGSEILSNSIIKGDVFTILPGEIHSYSDSRMFRNYNLCIGTDLMREMTNDLQNLTYFDTFFSNQRKMKINQLHLTPMDFLVAENLIKRIALLLHSKLETKNRKIAVKILLMELFLQVFDGVLKGWKQNSASMSDNLFMSINKLEQNPQNKVNFAKLAREIGMSLSSYAHKFKDTVGVPPSEYLNLLRLENAKKQLEETDLPLFDIAVANGFSSDNYFIRMFKKRYGITPKRYRMLYSSPAEPA
jgi:AraC-like DNA-binding protein